jgi:hypothetical protein
VFQITEMSMRKALREAQETARSKHFCMVYWEGEDAVTVLPMDKVSVSKPEVGYRCSVHEGRPTHTLVNV